jgi:membrane-associated protein
MSRTFAILGLDPDNLIRTFGTLGVFAIIFAETGLLVGFFLPGDSLLFVAGLFSARGDLPNIAIIAIGCAIAAMAGDQCGFAIGHHAGPRIFTRPDSRFFKHQNVERAEEFFEHYGPRAIILARFVPVVRTFTPVIIGASNMRYRRYVVYSVIGGILWGAGVTTAGWALGLRYPWMADRIEIIVVIIVAISLVPMAFEFWRHRRKAAKAVLPVAPEPIEDIV